MAPSRAGPRIAVARAPSPTPSARSSHSFLDEDPYPSSSRNSHDASAQSSSNATESPLVTTADLLKRLENLLASKANEIQLAGTLGESLLTQQSILEARIAEFAEVLNAPAVFDPNHSDQRRARGEGGVVESDEEEKQVGEETRRRLEELEAEMNKWDESNSPLYQVVGMAVHQGLPTNESLLSSLAEGADQHAGSSTGGLGGAFDSPPRNLTFSGPPDSAPHARRAPPSFAINANNPLSQSLAAGAEVNGSTPNAAASRRARNNAQHRNNDIELATEIGQSLLGEVRRLQSLLAEKEEMMRESKEEKDALERDLENSNEARKTVEENLEKYKEENWNLELATQEMRTSLIDAQSSVQKADLDRGRVLKDLAANRDLLEAQRSESEKLLAQLEALKARHETDMATMRKHSAGLQREKSDLTTALDATKAELAVRARGIRKVGSPTAAPLPMMDELDEDGRRDDDEEDVFGTVGRRKTGEGYPNAAGDLFSEFAEGDSPDSSPVARVGPEGSGLDQTAMAHAQRTIATLRASLAREKAAKLEFKKQLAVGGGGGDAWDDSDAMSSQDGTPYRQTPPRSTRGSARGRGSARRRGGAVGIPSRLGNHFVGDSLMDEEEVLDSFADQGEDSASIFEHQFPLTDFDQASESGTDDYDSPIRHAKRTSTNDLDPSFAEIMETGGSDNESVASHRAHVTTLAAALGRPESIVSVKGARPTSAMFADSTNRPQSRQASPTKPTEATENVAVQVATPDYIDVEMQTSPDPELLRLEDGLLRLEDELRTAQREIVAGSSLVEEKEAALVALAVAHAAASAAASKEFDSRTKHIKDEHATDLDTLRNQYDTILKTNSAAHSGQIASISEQHRRDVDSKLSAMSAKHDNVLASMATAHEASVQELISHHAHEISTLSSQHAVTLFDLQAAHKEAMADLVSSHSAGVADLKASHQRNVADIRSSHENAVKELQSKHETAITNLQASHEERIKELLFSHQSTLQGTKSSHDEVVQGLISSHQAAMTAEREASHKAMTALAEGHAISIPPQKHLTEIQVQTEPLPPPPVVVRPRMEDRGLLTDPLVELASAVIVPEDSASVSTIEQRLDGHETGSDTAGGSDTEFEDARENAASPVPRTDYAPSATSIRDFASVKTHRTNESDGSLIEILRTPTFATATRTPFGRVTSPLRAVSDAQVQTEEWRPRENGTTTPGPSAGYDPKRDSINTFGRSETLESAAAVATAFLLNSTSAPISERAQSPDDVFRPESAFSSFSQKSDSISIPPQTPGKVKGPATVAAAGAMGPPPPPSRSRGPTPRKSTIGSAGLAPPRPTSPPPPDLLYRAQSPIFDGEADRRVLSVPVGTRAGSSSLPPPPPRTPGSSHPNVKAQSLRPYPSMNSSELHGKGKGRRGQSSAVSISDLSIHSDVSRRMSIASSRTSDGGYDPVPVRATGDSTDPAVIHAITQTMIGEFLHKYTRRTIGKGISEKRHQRFFWVHPYTKTLYWSSADPGSSNTNQSSAKSVFIEGVRQVLDPNPFPPGLYQGSIIVKTPNREIQFTAPTRERHDMWFNAINYLLARPEPSPNPAPSPGNRNASLPLETPMRRTGPPRSGLYNLASVSDSRLLTPRSYRDRANKSSTLTSQRKGTAAEEYRRRGVEENGLSSPKSMRTLSDFDFFGGNDSVELVDGSQIPPIRDETDGFEDLENVRACCDGKHDVGSLSRRSHHHHSHQPHSDAEGRASTDSTPVARKRSKSSIATWGRKTGTINSTNAPTSVDTSGRKNSLSAV